MLEWVHTKSKYNVSISIFLLFELGHALLTWISVGPKQSHFLIAPPPVRFRSNFYTFFYHGVTLYLREPVATGLHRTNPAR